MYPSSNSTNISHLVHIQHVTSGFKLPQFFTFVERDIFNTYESNLRNNVTLPSNKTPGYIILPVNIDTLGPLTKYTVTVFSVLILVVGFCGNLLTILVMRKKPFQASSASIYLPAMAVCDSTFLVIGYLHEWMEWYNIDIESNLCKIHRFLFYTSGDAAIWMIVVFTFDRFIAICFPFKKSSFCKPRKALWTVCVVAIICCFKNFHIFWTRGVEFSKIYPDIIETTCGVKKEYKFFESYVRPWLVFGLIMLLPFILVIIFNILIVLNLVKSRHSRKMIVQKRTKNSNVDVRTFYQTTTMCLSVSFAFLLFEAPSIVILIGKPTWKKSGANHAYTVAKLINNELVYFNHAINFYLYCLTGEKFRTELKNLFFGRESTPNKNTLSPSMAARFTRPSIALSETVSYNPLARGTLLLSSMINNNNITTNNIANNSINKSNANSINEYPIDNIPASRINSKNRSIKNNLFLAAIIGNRNSSIDRHGLECYEVERQRIRNSSIV